MERTFNRNVVIHNLNTNPSAIAIYNPAGQEISPDDVVISSLNAIAVNLESYVPSDMIAMPYPIFVIG